MNVDLLLPCGFGPGREGRRRREKGGTMKEGINECGLGGGRASPRVDVFVFLMAGEVTGEKMCRERERERERERGSVRLG